MARKKSWFDHKALIEYGERLEELGGGEAIKRATESAMKQAKAAINKEVEVLLSKPNLPAQGKYSHRGTLDSLDRKFKVKWEGDIADLHLGFDFNNGGLTSVFLMYGTPKMEKVPGLYEVLKGDRRKKIVRKEEKNAVMKILKRLGG